MPNSITIPIKAFDAEMLASLRARFGEDVELSISVRSATDAPVLSEEACWALIEKLDWNDENSDEAITAPLVIALSQLSTGQIYQFNDWMSEKLYDLDTPAHASVFQDIDEILSVDDFLYARCAVVANGKEVYEAILNDPSEMPTEITFEPLLYVAYRAFEEKTGEEMIYIPPFNYETYGNRRAWGSE